MITLDSKREEYEMCGRLSSVCLKVVYGRKRRSTNLLLTGTRFRSSFAKPKPNLLLLLLISSA